MFAGIITFTILTVVFAFLCIYERKQGKSFEGMTFKFAASISFVAIAMFSFLKNTSDITYFALTVFALIFGFIGDVFLGIKEIAPIFKSRLLPLGAVSFFIGHCIYISLMVYKYKFNIIAFVIAIIACVIAVFLINHLKMNLGIKLEFVLTLYYGLLFFKLVTSIVWLINNKSVQALLCLIGSVCFIVSDTALAFLYFSPGKRKSILSATELATYYAAQIAFALSVSVG